MGFGAGGGSTYTPTPEELRLQRIRQAIYDRDHSAFVREMPTDPAERVALMNKHYLADTALGLGALAGREVALAAAIARPERFAALVRSLGATVVAEAYFRDHQPIPPEALERLGRQASLIVVTAKDAARWSEPPAGSVAVLETGLELARGQERLGEALDRALRGPP